MAREVVDFLGIGTQKAGTSWIVGNLKAHPAIWTPIVKEIHYFDALYIQKSRMERLRLLDKYCRDGILRAMAQNPPDTKRIRYLSYLCDRDIAFTDDWYAHIFSAAKPHQKIGEFTPSYCAIGEEGIQHIKRMAPNVRLLYVIRDPVARAISSVSMLMQFKNTSQLEAIQSDDFQIRGDYARNIPLWDEYFGDQIMYLPFRMIASDPKGTMRRIEEHFMIEPYDKYPALNSKTNSFSGRIEIKPDAMHLINQQAEGQYGFLHRRFGEHFIENI